jgi:hypothetical protein
MCPSRLFLFCAPAGCRRHYCVNAGLRQQPENQTGFPARIITAETRFYT